MTAPPPSLPRGPAGFPPSLRGRDDELAGPPVRPWLVALVTSALCLAVLVLLLPNLWYGIHDISDIPVYQSYADAIGNDMTPFRDFQIEYPPLAVPLFRLPGAGIPLEVFMRRFSIEMGAVTLLAGLIVAATACALWPRGRRAYAAGAAYAAAVALTGAIIVNRYDVAVALAIAGFVLCLVRGWTVAAAIALGVGFALKITPVALLPLVLLLAGPPRRWLWPVVAFAVTGVGGFLPYLVTAPAGVWHVFRYHLERPLQIESVLGTHLLLGRLLGWDAVASGHSHGSHSIVGPSSGVAADLSGFLTAAALGAVYLLLLAIVAFGKVLSPQYFIWLVPVLALVVVRDRLLGGLTALVLLLTHIEFPAVYFGLVDLDARVVALVAVRNILVVVCFAVALWRLSAWGSAAAAGRAGPAPPPSPRGATL